MLILNINLAHSQSENSEQIKISGKVTFQGEELIFKPHRWQLNPTAQLADYKITELLTHADFNSDNCEDLLVRVAEQTSVNYAYSDCKNSFRFATAKEIPLDASWELSTTADIDGNRCADIIFPGPGEGEVTFYLSDCAGHFNLLTKRIFQNTIPEGKLAVSSNTGSAWPDIIICPRTIQDKCRYATSLQGENYSEMDSFPNYGIPLSGYFLSDHQLNVISQRHSLGTNTLGLLLLTKEQKPVFYAPYGWSSFPYYLPWDRGYVADYNGDGLDDILLREQGLLGWWISTAASGKYGIEIPVTGLPKTKYANRTVIPADLNGDGYSEILFLDAGGKELISYTLTSNPNLTGTTSVSLGKSIGLTQPLSGPYVCLGYNIANVENRWDVATGECPAEYALMGTLVPSSGQDAESNFVYGTCCRLPSPDILTSEHNYESVECQENFIATGLKEDHNCLDCKKYIKCTKINTARYQLGPASQGTTYGYSARQNFWNNRIDRNQIPPSLRYGLGRLYFNVWTNAGCLGLPWGSILTGKGNNGCESLKFREIQYKGISGDPEKNTAVKMFPDCKEIDNIYDPRSGCS